MLQISEKNDGLSLDEKKPQLSEKRPTKYSIFQKKKCG